MRSALRGLVLAASLVLTGCAGQSAVPTPDPIAQLTDGFDASVRRDVETLRAATDKFHDLAAAQAAGAAVVPACR